MGIYRVDAIESEVRARLKVPTNTHLASSTILQAINDGYKDVASRAFCIENEDTVTTVSGSRVVPFNGHRVNFVERITPATGGTSGPILEYPGPVSTAMGSCVGLAYGANVYCGVGIYGSTPKIFTSPDLTDWTDRSPTPPGGGKTLYCVGYSGTAFVAAGGPYNQAGYHGYVLRSTDGITWAEIVPTGGSRNFTGITYGNGRWVAVGATYGDFNRYTSYSADDGITWSGTLASVFPATFYSQPAIAYGNGVFCVVGGTNSNAYIATSADGVTWTQRTAPANTYTLVSVAYVGSDTFVAVSATQQGIVVSHDLGATWTKPTFPSGTFRTVTSNEVDVFIFGNSDGVDAKILKSSDLGETWAELTNPHPTHLLSSMFGNNTVVAAGNVDADSDIYVVASELEGSGAFSSQGSLLKIRPENCGHISTVDNAPQYWFPWGNNIIIEPVPDAAYSLKLYISDYPAAVLSTSTDSPSSLPSEFHSCIVDFVCYALSLKMKKWNVASKYYSSYITNLKIRRQDYINRKTDRRFTHTIPGTVIYQGGKPWAH